MTFPLDEAPPPALSLPPKGRRDEAGKSSGNSEQVSGALASALRQPTPKINGIEQGDLGRRSQFTGHRSRVTSVPAVPSPLNGQFPTSHSHPSNPPSAGPYRTSFAPSKPSSMNGASPHVNGQHRHQASAMRQSLSLPSHSAHSRTRSVSGPFSPSSPSPLATSFSITQSASYPPMQTGDTGFASVPGSSSSDELPGSPPRSRPFNWGNGVSPLPAPNIQNHSRRHSRLHSRNLSVFFPRPGSLNTTSIDEDGDIEVEFTPSTSLSSDDGVLIPSASSPGPGQHSFTKGFTFGAKPPPDAGNGFPSLEHAPPSGPAKRGHHHKHSLSHNFFSFLEPGGALEELHTQPAPTPVSPWNPISPFPMEKSISATSMDIPSVESTSDIGLDLYTAEKLPVGRLQAVESEVDPLAVVAAVGQFILGASLWVVGQQVGSLSCTGLGYWVVSDAFGVALARVLPGYLASLEVRSGMRRPYGYVHYIGVNVALHSPLSTATLALGP